jgi:Concanavalin A-like lectin/glucanases superfamily/Carboxypeptidase regulatory-like domain
MSRIFTGTQTIVTPAAAVYANLDKASVSVWAKVQNSSNFPTMFVKNPAGRGLPFFGCNPLPNTQAGGISTLNIPGFGFDSESSGPTLVLNTWGHLVFTWDNSGGHLPRVYFNGTEVTYLFRSSFATGVSPSSDAAQGYYIGGDTFAPDAFVGEMSDFRIYNKELSPAEVFLDFLGVIASPANLVGRWKMCAGETTTVADSSGQGNTAVFLNGIVAATSTDDPPTNPCTSPTQFPGGIIFGNVGVSGATIECVSDRFDSSKTQIRFTASDAQGSYSFFGLPAGNYYLSASAPGFVYRHGASVVVDGANANTDINLAPTAPNSSNAS